MPFRDTEVMRTDQLWAARVHKQGISRAYIFEDTDYLTKAFLYWHGLSYDSARVGCHTKLGTPDRRVC
jgi:hypothetical protein